MSGATSGEKTEVATPKKHADALKEGDGLRSRDLGAAASTLVLIAWLALSGTAAVAACVSILRVGLRVDRTALDDFEPGQATLALVMTGLGPFAALWGALTLAAIAAYAALGGGGWSSKALAGKLSRIDPIKGITRLFGADALIGLAQSIVKVGALIVVTVVSLWWSRDAMLALATMPHMPALAASGAILVGIMTLFAGVTVVAALVDVLIQWQRRETRLKMSKQEVRDEHKSSEGSPERKRAQSERRYAIAANNARKSMREATVVLTNPKHFAVAIRYRPGVDGVPIVVARGTDEVARAIRDLAAEHEVPLLESAMLARALYFTSQVGQPVAAELYLAVATVLIFVIRLDAEYAGTRRAPDIELPTAMRFDAEGKRLA